MLFWVYILESLKDGDRYVGYTTDLRRRLEEHNRGESFSTKPRMPLKLIYCEGCTDEQDAKRREGYLKTTRGRRFIAKRLKVYYQSKL
ncbi:MAG: GIY-YIG nuclease family protein [Candidatus Sungbacteria bacterium]|nr:GIY-YIG nuclease family protein [Candidatus Sungbacteria bacterium]